MPTPYPEPVNFTGIGDIFTYVNTVGEGYTMSIFLLVMWVIITMYMVRKGTVLTRAALTSTYVVAIPAGLMFAFGMITMEIATLYAILAGIQVLIYMASLK